MSVSSSAGPSVTVPLWLPGITRLPSAIQGDLFQAESSVNTYTLRCFSEACQFGTAFQLAEGPSTLSYTDQNYSLGTTTVNCALTGTTAASCTSVVVDTSGATRSTAFATSPTFLPVTLTWLGPDVKLPLSGAVTAISGSGSGAANSARPTGSNAPNAAGAAATSSAVSKAAAAPALPTAAVGWSGAMAAFAVAMGAL